MFGWLKWLFLDTFESKEKKVSDNLTQMIDEEDEDEDDEVEDDWHVGPRAALTSPENFKNG